jgi:ComF family protein
MEPATQPIAELKAGASWAGEPIAPPIADLMPGASRAGALSRALLHSARRLVDALLPPRCLACAGAVDAQGQLCAACWRGVHFIADPYCECCGLPFEFDVGEFDVGEFDADPGAQGGAQGGARCGACLANPPAFGRARAVMRYDEFSRRLILAFKYADRLDAAPSLAAWSARAGAELLAGADLVAPVPLHRFRLWRRRYNQVAVLALALGRHAGRPVLIDLLRRVRSTPSQSGLSASQRRRNVRGAFAVRASRAAGLRAKRVLLIDDVMTTGATVEACARALLAAGAARVDILAVARVVQARSGV